MRDRWIGLQQQIGAFLGNESQHGPVIVPVTGLIRLNFQLDNSFGFIGVFLMKGTFQGPHVNIGGNGSGMGESFMWFDYVIKRIFKDVFVTADFIIEKATFNQLKAGFKIGLRVSLSIVKRFRWASINPET